MDELTEREKRILRREQAKLKQLIEMQRRAGQGNRESINVNVEPEEIEEGAIGGIGIQSSSLQRTETDYALEGDRTMSTPKIDSTRERDSLMTLDITHGSLSLKDFCDGTFSDSHRDGEHREQGSGTESRKKVYSTETRKSIEYGQRELEERIERLRNLVSDTEGRKDTHTSKEKEVKDRQTLGRHPLRRGDTATDIISQIAETDRETDRGQLYTQMKIMDPRGAYEKPSLLDRNPKSESTYTYRPTERESVYDDVFLKENIRREGPYPTEKRQEEGDEITNLKDKSRDYDSHSTINAGMLETKNKGMPYGLERIVKREDDDHDEYTLIDKLQLLQLQDKIIEEENRRRAEEERMIKERLIKMKERHLELDEERRRSQRLMEIKSQQEMMEKSLRMKIQEQIKQDERLRLLRKEESRLMKENDAQQVSTVLQQEKVQNEFGENHLDELQKKTVSYEAQGQETMIKSEHRSGDGEVDLRLKSKEEELNRREEYLKKLEKELSQKEDEIRVNLNLKPATTVQTANTDQTTMKPPEVTHLLKPYITTFSGSDPVPKNESTFEEWKMETECLSKSPRYHEDTVSQSIRNSLKGQARKVLVTLGAQATNAQIIEKLESVFGNVASGESILQEFYTATQKSSESVALWGIRIEEILQKAIEKGHVNLQQKNGMLKNKFWRALHDKELKNATRVHFESIESFELLRRKVRAEEYEMAANKSAPEKEREKLIETKNKPLSTPTAKKTDATTVEVQHQPVQPDTNTKLLKDLVKRMEGLENRLAKVERPWQGNRWNQGDWRNKKPNEQTKAKVTQKATDKKEPLNQ